MCFWLILPRAGVEPLKKKVTEIGWWRTRERNNKEETEEYVRG